MAREMGTDDRRIDMLRKELRLLIKAKGNNLCDPEVISLSRKLDLLVHESQEKKMTIIFNSQPVHKYLKLTTPTFLG